MSWIGGGDHERDMELGVVPMTVKFWGESADTKITRDRVNYHRRDVCSND